MKYILNFIFNLMVEIFNLMNGLVINFDGHKIYWGWLFVFISVLSMFVTVLWRGARRS